MTDKRTELKGKDKFLAGLTSFLEKNKNFLFIILAVFIVAIVIVAIVAIHLIRKRQMKVLLLLKRFRKNTTNGLRSQTMTVIKVHQRMLL